MNTMYPSFNGNDNERNNIGEEGVGNRDGKYGNPLLPFFGPPKQEIRTNPYRNVPWTNFDFNQYYEGKNEYLGRVIGGFIEDNQSWLTSAILPFRYQENLSVQWDRWDFNVPFTDVVPEEGVSRLISSQKDTQSRSMLRRGLAFQVEHGFWKTPDGVINYANNIRTIAQAVSETNAYDVLTEVVMAHTRFNLDPRHQTELVERQRQRLNFFGILHKDEKGLLNLLAMCRSILSKRGVKPNAIIVPPKLVSYAALTPANKLNFYIRGPSNQILKKFGPGIMDAHGNPRLAPEADGMIQGINVFITREIDATKGPPMDMLYRERQIGEYYTMTNTQRTMADFKSNMRSIMIYDEEKDDFEEITFKNAFTHCRRFGDSTPEDGRASLACDDLFTYKRNGEYTYDVNYWGQMDPKYLEEALPGVGESIIGRLVLPADRQAFSEGLELIRSMDEEQCTNWKQWIEDTNGKSKQMGTTDAAQMRNTLDLPDKKEDNKMLVPAGFNSWEGLRAILRSRDKFGQTSDKWDISIFNTVQKFVSIIKTLATRIENIFGADCIFLKNNSIIGSSEGTVAEALFENLINPFRYPLVIDDSVSGADLVNMAEKKLKEADDRLKKAASSKGKGKKKASVEKAKETISAIVDVSNNEDAVKQLSGLAFTRRCFRDRQDGVEYGYYQTTIVSHRPIQQADSAGPTLGSRPSEKHIEIICNFSNMDANDVITENFKDNWGWCLNTISDPLTRLASIAFLSAACNKDVVYRMIDGNVLVPFNFLITRPHMTYLMASMVVMKGGEETGNTCVGKSDFIVGDDPHIKMHYAHFTYYSKAIVKKEENIFIAEDIWSSKYLGGSNTIFHSGKDDYDAHIEQETDHYNESFIDKPSLYAMIIPYSQKRIPNPMHMSGSFTGGNVQYNTHDFYSNVYNIDRQDLNSRLDYTQDHNATNWTCYQGHQLNWKESSTGGIGGHNAVVYGKGHWGKHGTYPGCADVRNGRLGAHFIDNRRTFI